MKKAIVIGANGFLGSHLCLKLLTSHKEVIALVGEGTDCSMLKKHSIFYIECNLSELEKLDKRKEIIGADTIYHMAWEGVCTKLKNEANLQLQNVLYGLSVLEFAKRNHILRVIFPGSAAEYACGEEIINGKNRAAPADLYSAAKAATRIFCQTYARQQQIELICTAITSIYGPGRNDDNLITYTIKTLLNKACPQYTGLGQEWDYLYIEDLITALLCIGEKGIGGKVYPVGSGVHHSMAEYVKIIRDKIDASLPLKIGAIPYKNEKIDNQVLDISELQTDTGFFPRFSFEEGIALTIDYYKNNS